jgi:hypothetical protein
VAAIWLFPESRALLSKEGVTLGEFGLFVVIAYAAGQLVQAVGNGLEWIWWKPQGGIPSIRVLCGKYLSTEQHKPAPGGRGPGRAAGEIRGEGGPAWAADDKCRTWETTAPSRPLARRGEASALPREPPARGRVRPAPGHPPDCRLPRPRGPSPARPRGGRPRRDRAGRCRGARTRRPGRPINSLLRVTRRGGRRV